MDKEAQAVAKYLLTILETDMKTIEATHMLIKKDSDVGKCLD